MSSKVNLVWPAVCFAAGAVFGTSLVAVQETGVPSQIGPGPIVEQTAYYAKPGLADAGYDHRVQASKVRQKIGLPSGRVLRRVGGTGDLPDVVWQLEYADRDTMQRDLDARAKSPEFEQARTTMNTPPASFSRGFYQPAPAR